MTELMLMMIAWRPLEPPEWTGLILDTNLTDWHKELWQGEKVKMLDNDECDEHDEHNECDEHDEHDEYN